VKFLGTTTLHSRCSLDKQLGEITTIEKKAGDQTTFGGFQTGFDLGKRDPLDFQGT